MAKNSIRDYDATSANNTDVQSVDISEGCAASGINNAIREVMADLKNVSTGAINLETPGADQLNVDNIRIDGNTISSTNTNGDITLDPNGTGDTTVSGRAVITGASTTTYDATAVGGQATAGTLKIQNTDNNADVFAAIDFNTNNDRVVNRIVSGHGNTTSNGFLAFVTENSGTPAEAMRIDNDGKLIMGTTSSFSDDRLQIQTPASGGGQGIQFKRNDNNTDQGLGRIRWGNTADDDIGIISVKTDGADNSGAMLFQTAGSGTTSERMRIDSGGSVRINTTSNQIGSGEGLSVNVGGGGVGASFVGTATDIMSVWQKSSGGGTAISFYSTTSATNTGRISLSASATSYITSSDYRMKQGVEDMTGAIDRVKALAPKRFQFIADADTTVDGFLAHEAQAVVPEAVTGTHNEVDDDGNAVMQGIDQSKLVPLLTGALQEAIAKIETLETEMTALKARVTALEA